MDAHELSVPARDLDAGGKQVRFAVRAAWIRGALEGTDVALGGNDGLLDVRLSKSGNDVVVRGRLKAELSVPCARCLGPAPVVVDEPVSALAVPASDLAPKTGADDDGHDFPARDAEMIPYDGETLVLDDLVRDELLLAVPMIPLCSEGCPGIRPTISSESTIPSESAEPAVDPRLRPLLRLKKSPM